MYSWSKHFSEYANIIIKNEITKVIRINSNETSSANKKLTRRNLSKKSNLEDI